MNNHLKKQEKGSVLIEVIAVVALLGAQRQPRKGAHFLARETNPCHILRRCSLWIMI